MKKIRLLNILNVVILVLFLVSLIACYYIYNNIFNKIWYLIIIFYCAVRLYTKYYLFRSDSVLWFAIVLTGLWAFMIAYNFYGLSFSYWPLIAQIPSFASGIVHIIYKNYLHLYLNIIINAATSPLMLITRHYVTWLWFWVVEICAIVLAFVVINLIEFKFRRR